ncbi:MAG: uracil-DNA glycosylase family protein [Candidatus Woesearchaeota archaeon]
MRIVIIGISNKKDKQPFCPTTRSGSYIRILEQHIQATFSYTNLVTYAPCDTQGKLRYPTQQECKDALPHLQQYLDNTQPHLMLCCGKMVYTFIQKHLHTKIPILYIQHPGYVMRYGNKDTWITNITRSIQQETRLWRDSNPRPHG